MWPHPRALGGPPGLCPLSLLRGPWGSRPGLGSESAGTGVCPGLRGRPGVAAVPGAGGALWLRSSVCLTACGLGLCRRREGPGAAAHI